MIVYLHLQDCNMQLILKLLLLGMNTSVQIQHAENDIKVPYFIYRLPHQVHMETRLCLIQHQIVSQIKFYSLNSSKNKCSTNKYAFIIWLTLYTLIGAADTPSINPFNASPTFSYKNYIQDINHIKYVLLAVNTLECIFQLTNSCLI